MIFFEKESQLFEPSKNPVIPHPPPQVEKTPPKFRMFLLSLISFFEELSF